MRLIIILTLLVSLLTSACVSTKANNPYLVLLDKPEFQSGVSVTEVVQGLKEAKEILPSVPAISNCRLPYCIMCQFTDMENKEMEKGFLLLYGGKVFTHRNGFVLNTQGMACSYHKRTGTGKTRIEQMDLAYYNMVRGKYDDIPAENSKSMLIKYIAYNKATNLLAVVYTNVISQQKYVCRHDFTSCYSSNEPLEIVLSYIRIYVPSEKLSEQLRNIDLNIKKESLSAAAYYTLTSLKDTSFKAHTPGEFSFAFGANLTNGLMELGYKDATESAYKRFPTYYEIEKQNSEPKKDPNLIYKFLAEFMNAGGK